MRFCSTYSVLSDSAVMREIWAWVTHQTAAVPVLGVTQFNFLINFINIILLHFVLTG
jgi:hypothetical protein